MPSKTYTPKPIDIDATTVELHLAHWPGIVEALAVNTHEVWAELRIAEGWSYGKARDLDSKQTPCLVPYGELPDSEKEYDRQMAISVLGVIMAAGYTIRREVPAASTKSLRETDAWIADLGGHAVVKSRNTLGRGTLDSMPDDKPGKRPDEPPGQDKKKGPPDDVPPPQPTPEGPGPGGTQSPC